MAALSRNWWRVVACAPLGERLQKVLRLRVLDYYLDSVEAWELGTEVARSRPYGYRYLIPAGLEIPGLQREVEHDVREAVRRPPRAWDGEVLIVERHDRLIVDCVIVYGQPQRGPSLGIELVGYVEADDCRTRFITDLDLGGKLRPVELSGGDFKVLSDDIVLRALREQLGIADLAQQIALFGAVRPLEPRQVYAIRALRPV